MTNSPNRHVSRRTVLATVPLGGAMLLLAGCGSNGSDSAGSASTDGAAPGGASTGGASPAGYPATVDTAWGKLTLRKKPERIVAIGANYVDILSSLDEKPIAFSSGNTYKTEQAVLGKSPWLKGKFSPSQLHPDLYTATVASAEAIAALHPDLILGTIWAVPQNQYQKFSQIAPTYVGREKTQATSWTDILTDVAALTGAENKAKQVLAGVNATFAAAKKKLPGLQGKTYLEAYDQSNQFYLNSLSWARSLGLVPDPRLSPALSKNLKPVSLENIGTLDSDVLFVVAGYSGSGASIDKVQSQLEADPNFTALPAYKKGAVFYLTNQISNAQITNPGPSSMTWLLGQVLPELQNSPLNKG